MQVVNWCPTQFELFANPSSNNQLLEILLQPRRSSLGLEFSGSHRCRMIWAADGPSNPVQLEISSIYPAFIVLRLLRADQRQGEKSDEMATQTAPQSPSDNRRITTRAGPTGSIRAALAAEWFDWDDLLPT
jgi:hypothetical protein